MIKIGTSVVNVVFSAIWGRVTVTVAAIEVAK